MINDCKEDVLEEAYSIAKDNRKLEIELLWKRTTIFWGFLTALYIGVATIKDNDSALILSSLGFLFSIIWSVANRASKSWQESYELRADLLFKKIYKTDISAYDKIEDSGKRNKTFFLFRPWNYSLSRLLMLVSDVSSIFWLFICVKYLTKLIDVELTNGVCIKIDNCLGLVFGSICIFLVFFILKKCRTVSNSMEASDFKDKIDNSSKS